MKKSNSKSKALGAFKKLGAVALITATIFFVACKQTSGGGGGGGKPTPTKYKVTFTQIANGKVTASPEIPADGKVDKDTEITFTAEADDGYRVNTWIVLPNSAIQSGGGKGETTAKVKITADTAVIVSFEAIKYTVTLNKTEGGKVTASPEIPEDKQVVKNTEITFTAQADAGYKIGKWTVTPAEALQAGGADESESAKVKITADTTVSVSFELIPPGEAILTLDPNNLSITVKAKTADGSAITVEGCNETTLASGTRTTLLAKGTKVILKGKITELTCYNNELTALNVQGLTALKDLDCTYNKLTSLNVQGLTALRRLKCPENRLPELNVQGCTSLQELDCHINKLTALNVQGCTSLQELDCSGNNINAQAMTELLKSLPARVAGDNAKAILYTEQASVTENNCKDFNQSDDLKKAFDDAKNRNWKLQKENENGKDVEI